MIMVIVIQELKMTFFEESRKTSANIEATREPLQRGSSEMTERLVKAWIKEALDLYRLTYLQSFLNLRHGLLFHCSIA